jgi:hypothetical protein
MKKGILLAALIVLVSGCAPEIRTTGYLDRASGIQALPKGAAFAVVENAQAANAIFDREVKRKIEKLLMMRGYRVDAPDKADFFLSYSYSIDPRLRNDAVAMYGPPEAEIVSGPDGRGGITTRAVMMPGPVSVMPVLTTEYAKHLMVKVADAGHLRSGQKENVLWIGQTSSADLSSDLRSEIDYLLVATFAHFGRDTGKEVTVSLDKGDPDVMELRKDQSSLPR